MARVDFHFNALLIVILFSLQSQALVGDKCFLQNPNDNATAFQTTPTLGHGKTLYIVNGAVLEAIEFGPTFWPGSPGAESPGAKMRVLSNPQMGFSQEAVSGDIVWLDLESLQAVGCNLH